MNLVQKLLSALAGIFLAALVIAALVPKATRGVAAALVQVTNTRANPVPTVDSTAAFPFATTVLSDSIFSGSFPVSSTTSAFRSSTL